MGAEASYRAFLRITVQTPVYTDDYRRIGRVKQIQGSYFEVATGWLRRNFWLPAEVVAEAVPDQSVVLSVSPSGLAEHRLRTLPADQTLSV